MILAVKYLEPEYSETLRCLERLKNVRIEFVDRSPEGVGSLAEAFNRGFNAIQNPEPFVWMITNIRFGPDAYYRLRDSIWVSDYAAMNPMYSSDHKHIRKATRIAPVPFVEFTCPMVKTEVFKSIQLDEDLPYAYHDLVWSHQVKQAGHELAVNPFVRIDHQYIRHNKKGHQITWLRSKMREQAVEPSEKKLVQQYGPQWRQVLNYI